MSIGRPFCLNAKLRSRNRIAELATTAELVLEFLHATRRVDETLLAGVHGMGIHRDVAKHLLVLNAVDRFLLTSLDGGVRRELLAGRNIDEDGRVIFWVDAFFHDSREIDSINPDAP